ncbi:hypothetical protein [Celeribacter sp.]|uniref:hypothetical protein n=1 Tax=Celeribacter sp. TaxID=1890673 RepID=UPI003A8EE38A
MIARLLFTILGMMVLASSAFAETVTVRSGEHADFSRLVVQLDEAPPWAFGRSDDGYRLVVAREGVNFVTTDVFVRIPRTRILEVRDVGSSSLEITVAEDVHADAFELREGRIVIDIKNGPPDETSRFETPVPVDSIASAENPAAVVPVLQNAVERSADEETFVSHTPDEEGELTGVGGETFAPNSFSSSLGGLADFGRSIGQKQTESAAPEPLDPLDMVGATVSSKADTSKSGVNLAELEMALIEGIGRAVSDGLLEPSLPIVEDAVEATQPEVPEHNAEQGGDMDQTVVEATPQSHIAVQSAIQRAQEQHASTDMGFATNGDTCIPSRIIDVGSWGHSLEYGLDLPRLRAALVDELDAPVEEAAIDLAKYYIYLTFGAEALVLLDEVPRSHSYLQVYRTLGEIMEFRYAKNPRPLSDYTSCNSHAALWAVMATQRLPKGTDVNVRAVLQTLDGLPPHLRLHIGPGLAKRLIEFGDLQAASQVEAIVGRGSIFPDVEKQMLDAKVASAQSDHEAEAEILEDITLEHAATHPEALVRFVELAVEHGTPIQGRIAGIAEVVAMEYRDHEKEAELVETAYLAMLYSGDPIAALAYLENAVAKDRLPRSAHAELEDLALTYIIENSSDGIFLKTMFPRVEKDGLSSLPPDVRAAATDRFESLGFGAQADIVKWGLDETGLANETTVFDNRSIVRTAPFEALAPIKTDVRIGDADDLNLADLDALLKDISSNRQMLQELLKE